MTTQERDPRKIVATTKKILPFDVFGKIVKLISDRKIFLNLILSVKGLYEYVQNFPSSCENVKYYLRYYQKSAYLKNLKRVNYSHIRNLDIEFFEYPKVDYYLQDIIDIFDKSFRTLRELKIIVSFEISERRWVREECKSMLTDLKLKDFPKLEILRFYQPPKIISKSNNYMLGFFFNRHSRPILLKISGCKKLKCLDVKETEFRIESVLSLLEEVKMSGCDEGTTKLALSNEYQHLKCIECVDVGLYKYLFFELPFLNLKRLKIVNPILDKEFRGNIRNHVEELELIGKGTLSNLSIEFETVKDSLKKLNIDNLSHFRQLNNELKSTVIFPMLEVLECVIYHVEKEFILNRHPKLRKVKIQRNYATKEVTILDESMKGFYLALEKQGGEFLVNVKDLKSLEEIILDVPDCRVSLNFLTNLKKMEVSNFAFFSRLFVDNFCGEGRTFILPSLETICLRDAVFRFKSLNFVVENTGIRKNSLMNVSKIEIQGESCSKLNINLPNLKILLLNSLELCEKKIEISKLHVTSSILERVVLGKGCYESVMLKSEKISYLELNHASVRFQDDSTLKIIEQLALRNDSIVKEVTIFDDDHFRSLRSFRIQNCRFVDWCILDIHKLEVFELSTKENSLPTLAGLSLKEMNIRTSENVYSLLDFPELYNLKKILEVFTDYEDERGSFKIRKYRHCVYCRSPCMFDGKNKIMECRKCRCTFCIICLQGFAANRNDIKNCESCVLKSLQKD